MTISHLLVKVGEATLDSFPNKEFNNPFDSTGLAATSSSLVVENEYNWLRTCGL
jgi:hypothetical protein